MGWIRLAGRIVGPRLPEGLILDGVLITRDRNASRLERPRNLAAESGREGGGFLTGAPSEITTESDAIIEIRLKAKDVDEAIKNAHDRLIRPLLAALTLSTGGIAHVELSRVATEDEFGNIVDDGWSIWSDSAMFSNLGEMPPMDPEESAQVISTIDVLRRDKVAASGAADLVEASKMSWTTGGRTSEVEAAVLRYFHVIERVATRVAANRQRDPSEDAAKERLIRQLTRDLATGDVSLNSRRIKNAARSLDVADGRRLASDIAYACMHLGLSDDIRTDALNLNKLRNQTLAHPGKGLAERAALSNAKASDTAQAFLKAYVSWRAGA